MASSKMYEPPDRPSNGPFSFLLRRNLFDRFETAFSVSSVGVSMAKRRRLLGRRIRQRFSMRQYSQQVSSGRTVSFAFASGAATFASGFQWGFLYRCLFGQFGRHGCGFGTGSPLRFGICSAFDPVQIPECLKHALPRHTVCVCGNIGVCATSSASATCSSVRCFGRIAAAICLTVSPLRTVWVFAVVHGCNSFAVFYQFSAEGFGVLIFLSNT